MKHIQLSIDDISHVINVSTPTYNRLKRDVAIYQKYLSYRHEGVKKSDAIVFTSEDFNISDRSIYSIIKKFKV